jgi:hypothetical protein
VAAESVGAKRVVDRRTLQRARMEWLFVFPCVANRKGNAFGKLLGAGDGGQGAWLLLEDLKMANLFFGLQFGGPEFGLALQIWRPSFFGPPIWRARIWVGPPKVFTL